MKNLIATFSKALGLHGVLVACHKSRLYSASEDMKRFGTETTMPVWCSQRFQRHLQALRRLGFVVEKEFALRKRTILGPACYRDFCRLMRLRFPNPYWTCAASGTRVIVTAPPSQMAEWQRFLSEYEQGAA